MAVDEQLPARSREVARALAAAGVTGRVRQLSESARTAAEAAAALGCEVGAIANSLVFVADEAPLLVLTSGRHRVDTRMVAQRCGFREVRRASAAEVRAATGQAIGGVAPVGHPHPLPTVVDAALTEYPEIWAAAGTPHTVFATTAAELVRLTGGRVLMVAG
ncbi:YbaK/EbsC family protein [Nocardia terpenica]|uniref:YbaK/EbsC family protein n=1 Tax=Nocardia terpenica TaxID=455432 RepID=UPI0018962B79|nr:YbaK/EbsC family protein [Nocardia terpenica]MBF6105078.1 YbaK/EbsC family protein [Nocardia terpenica]MBF6112485.1 YbaK/EbsC family protein [Nocardia terpenica]MBF6118806.1 YbaK/EbsC family protein [Nocardia terpenica]MBF6154275.1 YbaK/EbsC family protein [Nocardia terpenica]